MSSFLDVFFMFFDMQLILVHFGID